VKLDLTLQANALFEGFQSEFIAWGVKPKTMLNMQHATDIDGKTPADAGAGLRIKR